MMSGLQRTKLEEALGLDPPLPMPYSIESEQALLGGLLMHPNQFVTVSDFLTPAMFWEDIHRRFYELLCAWIPQEKPVNALTVKSALGDAPLGGLTTSEYMERLRAQRMYPHEVRGYAKIVRDLYIRRCVIGVAQTAIERAYNAPLEDTGKALVESIYEQLAVLRPDSTDQTGFQDFDDVALRVVKNAEESLKTNGRMLGHSTGLSRLDDVLGGLQPTDLIIVGARPGMGKSALAGNIAWSIASDLAYRRHIGEKAGHVGIFTLEMSSDQYIQRLLCMQAGVPSWKARKNKLSEDDVKALNETRLEFRGLPFKIEETGGLNIHQLTLRAKAVHKKTPLEILIVDYLQLMQGAENQRKENRTQELTQITMGLKTLAKELKVPVMALSQLGRDLERRDDRRPQLSDLRESGSIEQDADMVLFIYRDEYYLPRPPDEGTEARLTWERRKATVSGVAEIIIGKHRHLGTGTVELGFDGTAMRFLNEPPPRDDTVEPIRTKKQGLQFHAQSIPCLERLKMLVMNDPVWVDDAPGTPRWAERVASYDKWKSICCGELLDKDATDPEKRAFMKSVIQPLMKGKLIERGPGPDYEWVWLTENGKTWTEGTN